MLMESKGVEIIIICNSTHTHTPRFKKDAKRIKLLKKASHSFFMEVVSSLCFGQRDPPEPALISSLMDTVLSTADEEGTVATRELSYREEKIDKVPVIRSFLLQLVLDHKSVNCVYITSFQKILFFHFMQF